MNTTKKNVRVSSLVIVVNDGCEVVVTVVVVVCSLK